MGMDWYRDARRKDGYAIIVQLCLDQIPLVADLLQHITRSEKPYAVIINSRAPTLLFEVSIYAEYQKISAPGPFKTYAEEVEEQDRDLDAEVVEYSPVWASRLSRFLDSRQRKIINFVSIASTAPESELRRM